ncbi:Bug family tripartite tricarboxylate transporter substrate binding protein [Falsiroseomonas selenitidurans]|uniref:Tripartite tricarboxylate transporter substrate binding protein n=1 Tax=Falsiroseomonas selenitidurans TaxID=2716335 RepID=A0ABX1EB56_9PROT|nr:tripartite tricarboxylate transporter substrate binding protein [Falsiroseomonas selenitidurans]NKC34226.1 tripartite tricarboxylate transporter substrate binding protein [Falsiroseomonas selenitidurans]
MRHLTRRNTLALSSLVLATPALAQRDAAAGWPQRPVKLVVPYAPGGTTDVMARLVAEQLGNKLGQPMIVENRPGAGATIGAGVVAQAEPDGLTLLMSNSGSHGVSPSLYPNLPYDPMKDFTHVALVVTSPSVLVVTKNNSAQDMAQFIAQVKRAGEIDFAVSGIGSSSHLTGVRLGMALDVRVTPIPYRGAGPAMTDTIAGVVPAMMDSLPSAASHINAGSVRALAVSSETRSPRFPNLPTLRESGVDVVNYAWFGISGPARLPAPIVQKLAATIRAVLAEPAMISRFEELTGSPPPESTPESYTRFVESEIAGFAPIVRAAGVTPR